MDDLDQTLDPQEEPVEEPAAEPPRLYAGKYKTVEEMERAYEEAQSTMTRAQQEAADLRRQAEPQGNPATQQSPPLAEDWDWDNPAVSVKAVLQHELGAFIPQIQQQLLAALAPTMDTALKSSMGAQYPDWNDISDDVESTIRELGFKSLSEAANIPKVMETVVFAARGKRGVAPSAQPNPADRQAQVRSLGVSRPQGGEEPSPAESLDSKDKEMLARFGLDAKGMAEVAKYAAKEDER